MVVSKKLLVVIPEHGGSRTLGENVIFALSKMGHQPVVFDFGKYTRSLSKLVNGGLEIVVDIVNQSLIVKALEEKVDAVLVIALSPVTQFALQILRNARIKTLHYFCEDLSMAEWWEPFIAMYDHFFVIQDGVRLAACRALNANTHYLPNGAPLEALEQTPPKKEFGAVFVGSPYLNRIRFFERLAALGTPFRIWGWHWDQHSLSDALKARIVDGKNWLSHDDILAIYAGAAMVINLHSTLNDSEPGAEGDFVNPRAFTIPLCRSLQLSDRRAVLAEFFTEDKDIVYFDSPESLAGIINRYETHPELAESIIEASYRNITNRHLLSHRMDRMLTLAFETA